MKPYFVLTKIGITIFVLLTGLLGYAFSFSIEDNFSASHFLSLVFGLFFLSGGSLALNQIQDRDIDKLMKRTLNRPLVSGQMTISVAYWIAITHLVGGVVLLSLASQLAALLGVFCVALYNGPYTMFWKRSMAFGAVPGAIPGSLPVTIGFAANSNDVLSIGSIYLFVIMFLWQMPHFWALAIKFKDDYALGSVPVLPSARSIDLTLNQMLLYMLSYSLLALASPLFVQSSYLYLFCVVPAVFKLMFEFVKYYRDKAETRFLPFFMWMNISMLIFLFVPVADRWIFLIWS